MNRSGVVVWCMLLAGLAIDSVAADWEPLQGSYAITARNYLDPSDAEPRDSHMRFQLSGDAARDLYFAMKVAEKRDACTGATARTVGEMQCVFYKDDQRYACSFSIDVARQKIEYGVAC